MQTVLILMVLIFPVNRTDEEYPLGICAQSGWFMIKFHQCINSARELRTALVNKFVSGHTLRSVESRK